MTHDQKQVMKAIGTFVLFKALLYFSINRAAKAAREMAEQYDPNFQHTMPYLVKRSDGMIGGHAKISTTK